MSIAAQKDRIIVAADHELQNKVFYIERIWKPARVENQVMRSRAAWIPALTMLYDHDGKMFYPDGRPYRHDEIQDVFPDQGNRWMDYFLAAKDDGETPKSFCRKWERLRLIEVYCRLVQEQDWASKKLYGQLKWYNPGRAFYRPPATIDEAFPGVFGRQEAEFWGLAPRDEDFHSHNVRDELSLL